MAADRERVEVPDFTQVKWGEASEDTMDEKDILADQDVTSKAGDLTSDDENMGVHTRSLDSVEDEPDEFMQGEIDVKEQMDRTADAMDTSLRGLQSQSTEDSPRTELGASFKFTPGGLEEVEQKTDEYLASHAKPTKKKEDNTPPAPTPSTAAPMEEDPEDLSDFDEPKMNGQDQIH
jgi:hypothetical protein